MTINKPSQRLFTSAPTDVLAFANVESEASGTVVLNVKGCHTYTPHLHAHQSPTCLFSKSTMTTWSSSKIVPQSSRLSTTIITTRHAGFALSVLDIITHYCIVWGETTRLLERFLEAQHVHRNGTLFAIANQKLIVGPLASLLVTHIARAPS